MSEETTTAMPNNDVKISIEQICAAILAKIGSVELDVQLLLANYSNKSIAVTQDQETKAITFTLADAPETTEISEESNTEPAE